jgi:hypothetical protein
MADWGIKATVPGADISSTDPADYTIWSKYPNLKVFDNDSGWPTSVTISSGNYNADYTITHNLGYTPLYDLYFTDLDGKLVRIPGKSTDTYGTRGRIISEDTNSITVRLGRGTSTYPTNVQYQVHHLIFVDPNEV